MVCQAFREQLLIDCDGVSKPFASVLDPWQEKDFRALDSGWEAICGHDRQEAIFRAYLERPRGHSKTLDIAAMAAYVLFSSPRKVDGVAAADDREQARLIRNAMDRLVRLNPWLAAVLDIQNYQIKNKRTGSILEIISNDAGSSYGLTPDFVIVDELTHWKKRDLWDSLFSAAAKRAKCMVVIIANAGFGQGISWQWKTRETARTDADWYFSRVNGPQASWISAKNLDGQRKMMPTQQYKRLWDNEWVTESGEGLEKIDIDACCTLLGPSAYDSQMHYLGALDLGVKNDHSALIILGVDWVNERVFLADCQSWAPDRDTGQVHLPTVRQACLDAHRDYHLGGLLFDPSQAHLMAQDLADMTASQALSGMGSALTMIEQPFVGQNLNRMATTLLRVFRNRLIDLYDEPRLIEDLLRIQLEERVAGGGYKLTAISDERGHADRAIALAIALPAAFDWIKELRELNHSPGDGLPTHLA